jgi:hypothetical protein
MTEGDVGMIEVVCMLPFVIPAQAGIHVPLIPLVIVHAKTRRTRRKGDGKPRFGDFGDYGRTSLRGSDSDRGNPLNAEEIVMQHKGSPRCARDDRE